MRGLVRGVLVGIVILRFAGPAAPDVGSSFLPGTKLVATLTSATGATTTMAVTIRRCGRSPVYGRGCYGRFRRCAGPACPGARTGRAAYLPPNAYRQELLIFRGPRQRVCTIHLDSEASGLPHGDYQCGRNSVSSREGGVLILDEEGIATLVEANAP